MRKAFTLVELLIVIIIIAVLAAIAIPKFQHSSQRAREVALKQNLQFIREALEKFHNDCDGWPVAITDIALTSAPANYINNGGQLKALQASKYKGPYLSSVPNSPIKGGGYVYVDNKDGPKPLGTLTHTSGTALDGTNYANW